MEAWSAQHKAGPIGLLMYRAEGADPMDIMVRLRGYCIYFVGSLLLSCVMMAAQLRSFALRLAFVIIAAAFAAMVCHVAIWNWMMFPDKWAIAMTIDTIIGWTIAAFSQSKLLPTMRPSTSAMTE